VVEAASLRDVVEAEARKDRRRSVVGWLLLVLSAGAAVALGFYFKPKPILESAKYKTLRVSQGDVIHTVSATGRLESRRTVQVGAEISGRIETVEVDYDDQVQAGQVLLRFNQESLKAQLAQVRAQVRAAEAAVLQAQIDAEEAQRQVTRSKKLFEMGADTESRRDAVDTQWKAANARVVAARAQVDLQKAGYELVSTSLAHTVVRAPIAGVVISRSVEPGQTVAAALQAPVLFSLAADLREMRVLVSVDEADVGVARPGQHATFTVDAYPTETFSAEVREIRSAPTITQGVVTYEAVLFVDNAALKLKPGMTASVKIRTEAALNVLRVPNAALRFSPPTETGKEHTGQRVWVRSATGPVPIAVVGGITDGTHTAVTAPGITLQTELIVDLTADGRKAYGLDDKRK
jgi:HlyD family secretion protein